MCGFVGFTGYIENQEVVLQRMLDKIVHRGPDSEGKYIDHGVALGFRRLSIIDLDGGNQPLFNEDRSLVLVFNGEIYNYQTLRKKLVEQGHRFVTDADSEVLVHAYEQYGTGMLRQLRGMFSFVIWDKRRQSLFGARDFFGIKPLYYACMDGGFLFASEIKSFLPHPCFRKCLNERALQSYLTFQYSPTTETFFQDVYKLPAAHYFTYSNGLLKTHRYWEPRFHPQEGRSLDEWVDDIDTVFSDSVRSHKISDVEVGSFLSSGVDSSYVACEAKVDKTFTVGFDNSGYSEISYAQELSRYIHVENFSHIITPEEYWQSLSPIQYQMDEPLADPAAIALYFVCREAAKKVKVVLSGEGADEIFGGYNIYKEPMSARGYNTIPMPVRRCIGGIARQFPHKRGVNFLIRRGKTLQERFIGGAYIFDPDESRGLLCRYREDFPSPQDITRPFYEKAKEWDDVTQMQYLDLHLWLTGDILLKADKMSMAHSLELRVPFLDKEVMALASRIPTRYRVNKENTKYAMRQAALRKLPPQTANKKKLGFPVPIRVWLKEEPYFQMIKQAFTSDIAERFFHTDMLLRLLEDHRAGHYDNSRKIWTVFTFLIWYNEYFVKR